MTGGSTMSRSAMSALSLLGCALTLVFAAGAWAAPTGSGCQLSANVDFGHTPLTPGSTSPIGFKLSGTLSNCQTNISGAPAAGTIEIGQTYTDAATGKKYREPAGSGSSACANVAPGSWGGPAIVRWTGGGVTLVPLTFSNVGPLTDAIGAAPQATLQLQPVDPL